MSVPHSGTVHVPGEQYLRLIRLTAPALVKLGERDKLQKVLEESLEFFPENDELLFYLGNASLGQGPEGASRSVGLFRKAISKQPKKPEYSLNLGIALLESENPSNALQALKNAENFARPYEDISKKRLFLGKVRYSLARCQNALGRKSEARWNLAVAGVLHESAARENRKTLFSSAPDYIDALDQEIGFDVHAIPSESNAWKFPEGRPFHELRAGGKANVSDKSIDVRGEFSLGMPSTTMRDFVAAVRIEDFGGKGFLKLVIGEADCTAFLLAAHFEKGKISLNVYEYVRGTHVEVARHPCAFDGNSFDLGFARLGPFLKMWRLDSPRQSVDCIVSTSLQNSEHLEIRGDLEGKIKQIRVEKLSEP